MQTLELVLDRAGIINSIDEYSAHVYGSTPAVMQGKNLMSFVPAAMHELFYDGWSRIIEGKRKLLYINCEHPSGHLVPLELHLIDLREEDDPALFRLKMVDRSKSAESENELETVRENYLLLAETTTDAILQIDSDFKIKFVNSAVERTFGYETGELLNRSMSMLFPKSQYGRYKSKIERYFVIDDQDRETKGMNNVVEVLATKKSGELLPVEVSFGNSKGVGSRRILTCILRDVTLRKKADRRLRYLAFHDKLTSLGNRDRFTAALNQVLQSASVAQGEHAALLYLDLDGFKKINDSLGHEIGDVILKACARRLVNSLREGDQVYRFDFEEIFRLGGDEFTILLPQVRDPEDAAIVARRVIDRITEPFIIDEFESIGEIRLGVSIGITIIPDDGNDATVLLRNADAAMYRAKERGNGFVFFTEDISSMAVQRLMIEQGVRSALAKNEFELYYQPIMNAEGTTTSVEALARWNHPERGVVGPDVFIPVIEDTGLAKPFGTWVLATACRDLVKLRSWGGADLRVSVNISVSQLDEPDIAEWIHNTLERNGLDGSAITIELTETAVMENPERARRKLEAIKRLNPGITIAIDDFGTGYSSLAHLTHYPVDNLKIDRTFISRMNNEGDAKVVATIIDLGLILDLSVVAEGVETAEQLETLRKLKCDFLQGYFLQRPAQLQHLESVLSGKLVQAKKS